MDRHLYGNRTVAIIFAPQPLPYSNDFKSLFGAVLGQDGIICDDVGCFIGFNKGSYGIDDFDIGLGKIMEGTGTNNQVAPSHGTSVGSLIVVVYGEGIP